MHFSPTATLYFYRIRRIEDDFSIPLDDSASHTDLLLGVSLLLFEKSGPDFFLHTANKYRGNKDHERKQKTVKRSIKRYPP